MTRISIAVLRQRDQGSLPYGPRDVLCDRTPLRRRLRKRVRLEDSTESLLSRWRNDETRKCRTRGRHTYGGKADVTHESDGSGGW